MRKSIQGGHDFSSAAVPVLRDVVIKSEPPSFFLRLLTARASCSAFSSENGCFLIAPPMITAVTGCGRVENLSCHFGMHYQVFHE